MLPVTVVQRKLFAANGMVCPMMGSALLSGIRPVALNFDLPYPGHAGKVSIMINLLHAMREAGDFSRDLRIFFFDGTDVMFQRDGQSLLRDIDKYYADRSWGRKDILLNAETNQYPSARLRRSWAQFGMDYACNATAALPDMPSREWPYRYLNSGVYTALWPELIDYLEFVQDKVLSLPTSYICDQSAFHGAWLSKEFADNPFRQHLHLEHKTELFWAVTWNKAPLPKLGCPMHDPRQYVIIGASSGLVSNNYTKTTPYIIHFNGTGKQVWSDVIKAKIAEPRQYGKAAVVAARLLLSGKEATAGTRLPVDTHNDDESALVRAARSQNFGDMLEAMTLHVRNGAEGSDVAFASLCATL